MQEENQRTQRKPVKASIDWKPNACTVLAPGIEPGLSGAEYQGRTTILPPASPFLNIQRNNIRDV